MSVKLFIPVPFRFLSSADAGSDLMIPAGLGSWGDPGGVSCTALVVAPPPPPAAPPPPPAASPGPPGSPGMAAPDSGSLAAVMLILTLFQMQYCKVKLSTCYHFNHSFLHELKSPVQAADILILLVPLEYTLYITSPPVQLE